MSRFNQQKGRIGELFITHELISERDLLQALDVQKIQAIPLGKVLLNLNKVTPNELSFILSKHYQTPQISLKNFTIDYKLQGRLREDYAKEKELIVLRDENGKVNIALPEPDRKVFGEIKKIFPPKIQYRLCMAPSEEINYAHRNIYARKNKNKITYFPGGCPAAKITYQRSGPKDGALTMRLVDNIIKVGQKLKASDIHLEPLKYRSRVRYRVEGELHEIEVNNHDLQILYPSVIARFKVLGKLALDLRDRPQGGSFSIMYDNGKELQDIDYRISLLPTKYGEGMVLRVLNQTKMKDVKLEHLGITGDIHKAYVVSTDFLINALERRLFLV